MSDDYLTLAAIDSLLALSQPEMCTPRGAFVGVQHCAGMAMLLVNGRRYRDGTPTTLVHVSYDSDEPVTIKEVA